MSLESPLEFPASLNLYEINTVVWLQQLSLKYQQALSLGTVPDHEWDRLENLGFDLVWLMGMWQRSPVGRKMAIETTPLHAGLEEALPGWSPQGIGGSPYSIQAYEPDLLIGGWGDLRKARRALNQRGMGMILDFVPNHTGLDHSWALKHPDRYLQVDPKLCQEEPASFYCRTEAAGRTRCLARGRDPNFPPWQETLQINIFEPETRDALIRTVQRIGQECDGVRCDMAMLLLNSIFRQTWQLDPAADLETEFWSVLREEMPGFILIGEAYGDTALSLLDLGLDFVYDKGLYDQLLWGDPSGVRQILHSSERLQARQVRFLENHDEQRSLTALGPARLRPASWLIATVPGMKLYHHGQLEGSRHRIPVQLCRGREEPVDSDLVDFYSQVLRTTSQACFRRGSFALEAVQPAGDESHLRLIASSRTFRAETRLVVVNLTGGFAQGKITPGRSLKPGRDYRLLDLVDSRAYRRTASDLEQGLHVALQPYQTHVFRVLGSGF